MQRVNTDALQEITRSLGITGKGAQETEFRDGVLDQVIDVAPLVRRGRTLGISEGIFEATMRNIHTDAETLTTVVTPYNQTVGRIAPWPAPVPRGYDIWLLRANCNQVSGGGTFKGALFANYDATSQAFGEDDGGAAIVNSSQQVIAGWDGLHTNTFVWSSMGGVNVQIRPFRLLRGFDPGTSLTFSSSSSLTATFDCLLLLGLFPTGLGQDVIG